MRWSLAPLPLLLLVACLASVGGCALMDATIELEYGRAQIGRCAIGKPPPLLLSVIDRRRVRGRVGVKKNGYGTETASVYVDRKRPVAEWLQRSVATELSAAGLRLARVERSDRRYLQVRVALDDFFVEPKVGFMSMHAHALVRLEAVVRLPDGSRFARSFKGHHVDTFNFASGAEYQASLTEAARTAIRKLARGICGLIAREGQSIEGAG